MKISYLVTCSTETDTLRKLLIRLKNDLGNDELIIIIDGSNRETLRIIYDIEHEHPVTQVEGNTYFSTPKKVSNITSYTHSLNADYGAHKNWGTLQCSGDWIFQIDGDELPPSNILGENLHAIIESNTEVELIYVPRINDYKGVTEEHAKQWGWRLTNSKPDGIAQGRPLVNVPDYQGRIFKRVPDRIKWDRKLHEKIEGHTQYSFLPAEEDYAIYHDKTIEKQLETNYRYNKVFTKEDNMGHKVV
jgi:glycosyltransferase involved in cell wall biosynthesis